MEQDAVHNLGRQNATIENTKAGSPSFLSGGPELPLKSQEVAKPAKVTNQRQTRVSEEAVRRAKGTGAKGKESSFGTRRTSGSRMRGSRGGSMLGRRRGACSRTCIPQSGIPLPLCRIHIYAASPGDNSAIMRRARAHLSRRAAFVPLVPTYFDSFSSPVFPLHFVVPIRVCIHLIITIQQMSEEYSNYIESCKLVSVRNDETR